MLEELYLIGFGPVDNCIFAVIEGLVVEGHELFHIRTDKVDVVISSRDKLERRAAVDNRSKPLTRGGGGARLSRRHDGHVRTAYHGIFVDIVRFRCSSDSHLRRFFKTRRHKHLIIRFRVRGRRGGFLLLNGLFPVLMVRPQVDLRDHLVRRPVAVQDEPVSEERNARIYERRRSSSSRIHFVAILEQRAV